MNATDKTRTEQRHSRFAVALIAIYVAIVVIANVTTSKLVPFAGSYVPAAVFLFASTFTILDVINRHEGVGTARLAVWLGLAANILLVGYTKLVEVMPAAPFYGGQDAFESVLGNTWRIALASWVAFFISERLDAEIYHYWQKYVSGPLWLRVIVSNIVSCAIDSVIFIWIAFGGTGVPEWDLVAGQYKAKLVISTGIIPLLYGAEVLVRRK